MMAIKRSSTIAVILIAVLFAQACNDDQLREVATNIDRAAVLIEEARQIRDSLYDQGTITQAEAYKITIVLDRANKNISTLQKKAKTYQGLTAENKLEAQKLIKDIADGIDESVRNGSLSVKNSDSQSKVSGGIASIKEVSLTILALINSLKVKEGK